MNKRAVPLKIVTPVGVAVLLALLWGIIAQHKQAIQLQDKLAQSQIEAAYWQQSCEANYDSLQQFMCYSLNKSTTAWMLGNLHRRGITAPLDTLFVKVAYLESGYNFESTFAVRGHNYWGFHIPNVAIANRYNMQYYKGAALFPNADTAFDFLVWWINAGNIKAGQDPYEWLQSRGYNTANKDYYRILKTIEI